MNFSSDEMRKEYLKVPNFRMQQQVTVAAGFIFPLLLAWCQAELFHDIKKWVIFAVLTVPIVLQRVLIGRSRAHRIEALRELGEDSLKDSAVMAERLYARTEDDVLVKARIFWRYHLMVSYLNGHVFGWALLIFIYFYA